MRTVCTTARAPRRGFSMICVRRNHMKKLLVTLGVAALVLPAAAKADSEFSIVLQGGAAKYNQSLSGSDVGAAYGARLGIMPTPMLGVEVGYLGSQNNINESLNQGRLASTLKTNEGYGDVRLNILPGEVTPYVFGGYGYTWVNGAEASGIRNSSTHTLPFGGGLEANIGAFKLGGRFQYNYLFSDINTGSNTVSVNKGGNSDFWTATVDLGASFR
ncbi:MAG: porin family protein [Deltaproteobacteria bacterium]|nr:MAG: porin family protein [Deltaproteobacteria bacterium]